MSLKPERLARVIDRIEHGLAETLTVADLATAAHLSTFHFARMFKRTTGLTPQKFLMEKRMERAREMLSGTELPLAEVSRRCGFRTQSHFTETFRRYHGVTPRRYRSGERLETLKAAADD